MTPPPPPSSVCAARFDAADLSQQDSARLLAAPVRLILQALPRVLVVELVSVAVHPPLAVVAPPPGSAAAAAAAVVVVMVAMVLMVLGDEQNCPHHYHGIQLENHRGSFCKRMTKKRDLITIINNNIGYTHLIYTDIAKDSPHRYDTVSVLCLPSCTDKKNFGR